MTPDGRPPLPSPAHAIPHTPHQRELASSRAENDSLRERLAAQEISTADVERLVAQRAKLEESRAALAAQRAQAERATCECEVALEQRVEEIGAGARAYEQAAEALKIVPFGAKRSNNVRRPPYLLPPPPCLPCQPAPPSPDPSLTKQTKQTKTRTADALRAVGQHPRPPPRGNSPAGLQGPAETKPRGAPPRYAFCAGLCAHRCSPA